jgi:hypothetical protein
MTSPLDGPMGYPGIREEELAELRKGLLEIDRVESRSKGCRRLSRIALDGDLVLAPIAHGGLASAALWSGDLACALRHTRHVIARYPMAPEAIGCSTLLVRLLGMLGMKRERFEAEGERLRILRRIALKGKHAWERTFALRELRRDPADPI